MTALNPRLAAAVAATGIPLTADVALLSPEREAEIRGLAERATPMGAAVASPGALAAVLAELDRVRTELAAVKQQPADDPNDRRRRIYIDGKGDGWIDLTTNPATDERDIVGITDQWKVKSADDVAASTGSLREIGRCW